MRGASCAPVIELMHQGGDSSADSVMVDDREESEIGVVAGVMVWKGKQLSVGAGLVVEQSDASGRLFQDEDVCGYESLGPSEACWENTERTGGVYPGLAASLNDVVSCKWRDLRGRGSKKKSRAKYGVLRSKNERSRG
jgi:hypothetical protein